MGLSCLVETIQRELGLERPVIESLLCDAGFSEYTDSQDNAQALAAQLRGPMENHFEQVAQELRLSMGYASSQYPDAELDKLLLTGGGAAIPGLAEHLSRKLEVTTSPMTPMNVCRGPRSLSAEANSPALMIALGLAWFRQEVAA